MFAEGWLSFVASMTAFFGSLLLWLVCLALVVWRLMRLRRALSIVVAIALIALTVFLAVWSKSAWAWVSSLVLVIVGFVFFRRPGALLSVVCVVAWVAVTWMTWGWVEVYEKTGECLFPATLEDPLPDLMPCELPQKD